VSLSRSLWSWSAVVLRPSSLSVSAGRPEQSRRPSSTSCQTHLINSSCLTYRSSMITG